MTSSGGGPAQTILSRRDLLYAVAGTAAVSGTAARGVAQSPGARWPQHGRTDGRKSKTPVSASASTPSKRWSLNVDQQIGSSPTVVSDRVYATLVDGRVVSVSDAGDIRIYELDVTGVVTTGRNGSITSTPTFAGNTMYVGSTAGSVHALSIPGGQQVWTTATGAAVRSAPIVTDRTVFVGDSDGVLHALDRPSGDRLAQVALPAGIVAPISSGSGKIVAATTTGQVRSFSGSELSEAWTASVGPVYRAPVVGSDYVFVGDTDGTVSALRQEDGARQWERSFSDEIAGGIAYADGTVYVTTQAGELAALSADDGSVLWVTDQLDTISYPPTLTKGAVLTGTQSGRLYAFDAATGKGQWRVSTGSSIASPIAVTETGLYFGDTGGSIYAFGLEGETTPQTAQQSSGGGIVPPVVGLGRKYATEIAGIGGSLATLSLGYYSVKRLRNQDSPSGVSESTGAGAGKQKYDTSTGRPVSGDQSQRRATDHGASPGFELDPATGYEDFTIEEQLGAGGKADVYRATTEVAGEERPVALKVPRINDMQTVDTDFYEEFVAEAEIWDKIDDHRNIVSVVGWGDSPHPWIALEYMDGGNLGHRLSEFDLSEALDHLVSVCEGVHHAHRQGITHTDLKPENVLFLETSGRPVPKVADWGLATVLLEHSMSVEGLTPAYSAPEQVDPDAYDGTDDRTDIYQLGVVAYELLTGQLPFEYDAASAVFNAVLSGDPAPPSEIDESLPSALDDILLKALAKEKADRYKTVLHFRDALRRVRPDST